MAHLGPRGALDVGIGLNRTHSSFRVAAAVVTHGGRVLLVHKPPPTVPPRQFPAGKLRPGESPADAAVRETAEETGQIVTADRVLGARVHPTTCAHIHYIACTAVAPTEPVLAREEIDAVEWADAGLVPTLLDTGTLLPAVAQHLWDKLR
ncbi:MULTISPECIES: NUDIX hydrolase [unclassified Streptomyces]|uniref:NUDIX hydrolase n=1 Tax=unclassified Streptomyces TaxID=2593676 RepID=UPI000CD4DDFA|nr:MULTISPECIES: NUDIX hydrolase [unclassified Streptomyces]